MDSDAVAKVLAEHPPALDDIARARMEQSLLEAARAPQRAEAPAPGRSRAWIAGGALAAAAAVALGWFALQGEDEAAPGRVAQMELRSVGASVQSGTIDEGSSLRTRIDEVAEIRIEDSAVHLEPSSEVRLAVLGSDRIVFELLRGEVRVEFHPRAPGEEGMSVQTSRATVEVVGTVFTVRETELETEVRVTEGVVRVVPREGETRSVAAGESTRVGESRAANVEPAASDAPPADPAADPAPSAAPDRPAATEPTQREARIVHTPAQLLARARRLSQQGDGAEAIGLLRQVARSPEASASTRAQAFNLLGDLLAREGELSEAAEAYDAAVRQRAGPLSHMAIYDLARLQERRLNDPEAARASYRRYLAVAEGGPLTGQVRQALCRLGDTDVCPGQAP